MTQGGPPLQLPGQVQHPLGPALNGHALSPLDLDAELDALDLSPVPMKIGGKVYLVRRDLSGPEVNDYWRLAREKKDVEAFSLLVGPHDGPTLSAVLDSMAVQRMHLVVRRLMITAGLLVDDGTPGESGAS